MTSAPGRAEADIKNIWVGFFSLPLPPLSSPSSLPSSPFSLMSSANVPRSDPETESAGTLWIELQNFEEPHLRTLGGDSDIIFPSRRKPAAHMAILSTLIFISMQFHWQFVGFEFRLNEMLILFNLPVFIIVRNKWAEDPFPLRKTHEGELSIPLTKAWQAHSRYDNTLWRELADPWDRKVSTDSECPQWWRRPWEPAARGGLARGATCGSEKGLEDSIESNPSLVPCTKESSKCSKLKWFFKEWKIRKL